MKSWDGFVESLTDKVAKRLTLTPNSSLKRKTTELIRTDSDFRLLEAYHEYWHGDDEYREAVDGEEQEKTTAPKDLRAAKVDRILNVPDEIVFQPGNSAWVLLKTQRRKFKHCPCCNNTRRIKGGGQYWPCPECDGRDLYENVDVWYTRKGIIKKRTRPYYVKDKKYTLYEIKIKSRERWVQMTQLFRTKKAARAECKKRNNFIKTQRRIKATSNNIQKLYRPEEVVWILVATTKPFVSCQRYFLNNPVNRAEAYICKNCNCKSRCITETVSWYTRAAKIIEIEHRKHLERRWIDHSNSRLIELGTTLVYKVCTYDYFEDDEMKLKETEIFKTADAAHAECSKRNKKLLTPEEK